RIIGAQVDGYFKFTIDDHRFKVVVADFVPIVPYVTDNIIIVSGQRYYIVVEANQPVGNYWIQAIYQTGKFTLNQFAACNQNDDNKSNILGVFRYNGSDQTALPTTKVSPKITNSCGDENPSNLVPWVAINVGGATVLDNIALQWCVFPFQIILNWSDPTTRSIYNEDLSLPSKSNVYTVKPANKWAYWVIQDLTLVNAFHPLHLHGHDVYILAQGKGPFVPLLVNLNTVNRHQRDTVTLYDGGYTVIAMLTDHPGSWLMHCYIAWHVSQGLAIQFVE
ncbi:hypothetical protein M427DRAFT_81322, partial [Gonapodya prolifera JEL478]